MMCLAQWSHGLGQHAALASGRSWFVALLHGRWRMLAEEGRPAPQRYRPRAGGLCDAFLVSEHLLCPDRLCAQESGWVLLSGCGHVMCAVDSSLSPSVASEHQHYSVPSMSSCVLSITYSSRLAIRLKGLVGLSHSAACMSVQVVPMYAWRGLPRL